MDKRYAIGVDIGGTNTKVALVHRKGKIVDRRTISTNDYAKKEALIDAIIGKMKELMSERGGLKKSKDLLGIGIGVPGLVDSARGIVYHLTNISGWKNVALKGWIEARVGVPTFIDNDTNLMALAEFSYGAGRGTRNLICLTLGTGVGGGLIIDGKLYRGSGFTAGEIGHIPIDRNGPRCNCGGSGCLEAFVGNQYIVKDVVRRIKEGFASSIPEIVKGDLSKITPQILAMAAAQGDELAVNIWQETGRYIGIALAGLVNFLNPEKIVIGGGVSKAGDLLFDSIRKTIKERAYRIPASMVEVVPAKLGEDAGLVGAAVLVRTMRRSNEAQTYGA